MKTIIRYNSPTEQGILIQTEAILKYSTSTDTSGWKVLDAVHVSIAIVICQNYLTCEELSLFFTNGSPPSTIHEEGVR